MESSSLTKALGILEATAGYPQGRSLADLAAEVGVPKPTAHRILKSLTGLGYLERPQAGVYRQSPQAKRLVSDALTRRLIEAAEEPLRELHARTKETVNLGMLRHDCVLYLEVIECVLPLRRIASRASDPFHTTALGRAMAAFLPREKQEKLLAKARLERRTTATITDRKQLLAVLAQVAEEGHAIEVDETDIGVTCIAAPVFSKGVVSGAISLSAPTARVTAENRERLVKLVKRAARVTSTRLSKSARARV
jgi:IclR family KDG regulon transcriptional repressor